MVQPVVRIGLGNPGALAMTSGWSEPTCEYTACSLGLVQYRYGPDVATPTGNPTLLCATVVTGPPPLGACLMVPLAPDSASDQYTSVASVAMPPTRFAPLISAFTAPAMRRTAAPPEPLPIVPTNTVPPSRVMTFG